MQNLCIKTFLAWIKMQMYTVAYNLIMELTDLDKLCNMSRAYKQFLQ